jgi:hypothetical protein
LIDPRVQTLCTEYGIEIVGINRHPDIGQTRAVNTLNRIMRRHGEDHLRLVLSTLTETANNKGLLTDGLLWATSDMVRACRAVIEERAGDWLDLWDAIDVRLLQDVSTDLAGTISQRYALGGMLYERIARRFGPGAAQPDLFDDRRTP